MIKEINLQVLDYEDKIIWTKKGFTDCASNCLESNAAGLSRKLSSYFNTSTEFEKIKGLGSDKPHTVVAFFTEDTSIIDGRLCIKITHYEDLEIDVDPIYVNEENINKCIELNKKTYIFK